MVPSSIMLTDDISSLGGWRIKD